MKPKHPSSGEPTNNIINFAEKRAELQQKNREAHLNNLQKFIGVVTQIIMLDGTKKTAVITDFDEELLYIEDHSNTRAYGGTDINPKHPSIERNLIADIQIEKDSHLEVSS